MPIMHYIGVVFSFMWSLLLNIYLLFLFLNGFEQKANIRTIIKSGVIVFLLSTE